MKYDMHMVLHIGMDYLHSFFSTQIYHVERMAYGRIGIGYMNNCEYWVGITGLILVFAYISKHSIMIAINSISFTLCSYIYMQTMHINIYLYMKNAPNHSIAQYMANMRLQEHV